ncbi:MAG: hypothetical protein KDB00_26815, partial [Planctomycetales bacterium]|nr:hypothetical protein [Planctomycetales bacterium]
MNASQRLFDRFDKAGPSWLPIIVLSLFGLSATIVSVYAISKTSSSVLKQAIESGFQLSRDVGKSSVYLFDFVAVDKDALSDIESKLVRITSSRNPGMSFLGALDGRPAFPPVSNDDSGQMMELSPPLNRRHYCWIDDLQTTLLICTFDWFEVDVRGTEHEYQPGESLPFSKALAISRVGPTDKSFRSTHASSSLPDLGDHENVLKLILHEAGVISELIDSHRVFVEPMDLVRFEPQDFDV